MVKKIKENKSIPFLVNKINLSPFIWDTDGSVVWQDLGGTLLPYPFSSLLLEEARFPEVRAIAPSPPQLTFLGSGDFHFLSLFLLEKVEQPFVLLLLDHHSDAQESAFGPLLSCGGWLRWAVELPLLVEARLWGPDPDQSPGLPAKCRIFTGEPAEALWGGPHPFYLSLDKDLLREEVLPLGWDQGETGEEELWELLVGKRRLLAADICGEPPDHPIDFHPGKEAARQQSERLNQRILQLLGA
ncbi:MAG: hypothetical protein NTV33_09130 [Coprothermobacterota bacterium]|nr:hypothetical protein [Coprothermobacterota bacterium]